MKKIVLAFGRFNPPTIGHEKLIKACADTAALENCDFAVYGSNSSDPKKNPLQPSDKLWFMQAMFPRYANNIFIDSEVLNPFQLLAKFNAEYDDVIFIAGSDRVTEYRTRFEKHMNGETATFFYNSLVIKSSGERDADSEGASGMSASKMRAAVKDNDVCSFRKGIPKTLSQADTLLLYNAVKEGMGL